VNKSSAVNHLFVSLCLINYMMNCPVITSHQSDLYHSVSPADLACNNILHTHTHTWSQRCSSLVKSWAQHQAVRSSDTRQTSFQ